MSNQQRLLKAISLTSELALALAQAECKPHQDDFADKLAEHINNIRAELDSVEQSFTFKGT